jgi:asparagine synthase (glutamine-hydrolysing)
MGYFGGAAFRGLLSPDLAAVARSRPDFALVRELAARAEKADYLTQLQYIDVNSYLPDDILVKSDRMAMLNSLEVRVPLLDHRVLEFAASVPPEWRLGKRILKKAAGHLLPPELLGRRKTGFGVPLKHWFRGDWREYARDLLLGQRARERGILDPRQVASLIDQQLGARGGATARVYTLVVLEEWCRQYLDEPARAR